MRNQNELPTLSVESNRVPEALNNTYPYAVWYHCGCAYNSWRYTVFTFKKKIKRKM